MRAVVFDKSLQYTDTYPIPEPQEGEVLIKVLSCGICNTDLEIIKGYSGFSGVLGHEFCGRVESSGLHHGKRVTGEINLPCRKCETCRTGLTNHCPHRKVMGIVAKDGCMADYVTLPIGNLHFIPDEISIEDAIFIEPLAAALQIIEQVSLESTMKIMVLGDGKLGILCSLALKLCCPNVILVGKHTHKLELVQDADIEVCLLSDLSNKADCDLVVDATGSPSGLQQALSLIKPKGTVVLKTTTASQNPVDLTSLVVNEATIVGSRCGPFDKAVTVLSQKQINVDPLITARYPLEDALQAFRHASQKESLKIVLTTT